eukprot:CAMPEP_0179861312 /NCGR_PEP_ID=MMETSP0982-20121206/14178_1 /TAXON_ID=483367 /ORGANISM="non described non described, Strain CCMP 2436" /LENGTH=61 /DNA_ID=CAMNT_0021748813 /DNA_START=44 /DNA_END=225 /DNA_ORIENTATION=-
MHLLSAGGARPVGARSQPVGAHVRVHLCACRPHLDLVDGRAQALHHVERCLRVPPQSDALG